MIFMEEWPEKVRNIRRLEWNSQKTIYGKVRNSEKQANIMYLDFFSPGATTPIGGCILQPSSGL